MLEKWGKEDWALEPHSPQSQRAEARCPRLRRRMAKRTSVRERRLKGKMPPSMVRSVRSPQTKKRRSSERRNKDWSGQRGSWPRFARPTPQAKAFGRIPKNSPLGGFLDGIPPHRFEPRFVLENENSRGICLGCKIPGADNGARTRDPHLGKVVLYQLSHVREVVGDTRFELVTPTVSR